MFWQIDMCIVCGLITIRTTAIFRLNFLESMTTKREPKVDFVTIYLLCYMNYYFNLKLNCAIHIL